jgi:hypothetical protein
MAYYGKPSFDETAVFVHDEKLGQQPVNSLRTKKRLFFNVSSI